MKTKSKPAPGPSEFDRWKMRVQAYCHELWGRSGFEGLKEGAWEEFWASEVRADLAEWDFANCVVLQWCGHYNAEKRKSTLLTPAAFATRKAVKLLRKKWSEQEAAYKTLFEAGRVTATATMVPDPPARPEPPACPEVGRYEQPPRHQSQNKRLRVMTAKAGAPPLPVRGLSLPALVKWVEGVTEILERQGEFPTVCCLMRWLHDADGLGDRDEAVLAVRRVRELYRTEYDAECTRTRLIFNRAGREPAPEVSIPKKEEKPAKPPPKVEARSPVVTVTEVNGSRKYRVFGHPVTAVLRWMGGDAWTFDDARSVMARLGIPEVKDNTLKAQLMTGRKGGGYGRKPAAKLTAEQQETLYALLEQTDGEAAEQDGPDRQPRRQGEEGRGTPQAGGKAQARPVPHDGKVPANRKTNHRPASPPLQPRAVPVRPGHRGRPEDPAAGRPAKARTPEVRPPDRPAGVRGGTGGTDSGKKDRKAGVGGGRPNPPLPDGKRLGGKSEQNRSGRAASGRTADGKAPVKGKPRTGPHSHKTTPSGPAKPPGKGKPARTGPKGKKGAKNAKKR